MKILYTIPNFITAGSGGAMLNIIKRLDSDRFRPAVCVSRLGGILVDVVHELNIPLIEADFTVTAKPYRSLISRAKNASLAFKPYKFDLWHSFHYAGEYTEPLIARLSGARAWVYTKKNMSWGDRSWILRSLLARRIAVQNSDMLKDFFGHPFYKNKVHYIPRGVNVKKFKPGITPEKDLRTTLSLPANAFLVGCVAHLVPVKGHPTLIDAISKIKGLHLVLAGKFLDQAYVNQLKAQVNTLGINSQVHFLGNVEDMPGLLAQLDLVVLPTWDRWRREGCPVALLEAMACGKSCIATDVPGSRDIIEDGISGFLVPPEDPDALANTMRKLIQNPDLRQEIGAEARKRVEAQYTIEKEVAAHEKMYMEIMKNS